jgi:hypothetical protein
MLFCHPMAGERPFSVVHLDSLKWPADIQIPNGRFRLFVAADVTDLSTKLMSEFAVAALKSGMVYFCAWGPGCERFHDIVDEVVVEDEIGDRIFVGKNESDTIMTTWHDDEPLDEALDFFASLTCPTAGFEQNSNFWVAVSLTNAEWAREIQRRLDEANLPIGDWPPTVR